MQQRRAGRGLVVLVAASLVTAVLGSIHAFSVFLAPLEAQFTVSRSDASLTYSLALVALTCAVLFGPRIFAQRRASVFVLGTSVLAAVGAVLAAYADTLTGVWLGYSLIFGVANGLGYGFGLQIAAQVNAGREGVAMGIVTAAYALGSVIAPGLFERALGLGGFRSAMLTLAACLLVAGVIAAALFQISRTRFLAEATEAGRSQMSSVVQRLLWLGYFGGVLAGLMVIGHAAGLAQAMRPGSPTWVAPVVIAACNLAGSLLAGRLVDYLAPRKVLVTLALMTAGALAGLAAFGHLAGLLPALGLVGFAYGGTIAAYPAAIAKLAGPQASARIYGRVFTAWGVAGLLGPWLAGLLFDASGSYRLALGLAAAIALGSAATARAIFHRAEVRAS